MSDVEVIAKLICQCPWPVERQQALEVTFWPAHTDYVWVCLEPVGWVTVMTVEKYGWLSPARQIKVGNSPQFIKPENLTCRFARIPLSDLSTWGNGLRSALKREPNQRMGGIDGMTIQAEWNDMKCSIWSPSRAEFPLFTAWVEQLVTALSHGVTDGEIKRSILALRPYLRD